MKELGPEFFDRDPKTVAINLLGKVLCRRLPSGKILRGRIVETEAYYAEDDPASRARRGLKGYNRPMFERAGLLFIYMVHANWLLNITTKPVSAVLIRAVEPINFEANTSGPGRLTRALQITGKLNGLPLGKTTGVWIEDHGLKPPKILASGRIGVKKDLPEPLRFFDPSSRFVSKSRKGVEVDF